MGTWQSAGSSSPPAWTLVTPQPGQGPSQSVHTNLTPPVATFNIRLLTDIMSISPGPSPTYLYSSQCNVWKASQLAKCGRKLELFLVIYNKNWKLHFFFCWTFVISSVMWEHLLKYFSIQYFPNLITVLQAVMCCSVSRPLSPDSSLGCLELYRSL